MFPSSLQLWGLRNDETERSDSTRNFVLGTDVHDLRMSEHLQDAERQLLERLYIQVAALAASHDVWMPPMGEECVSDADRAASAPRPARAQSVAGGAVLKIVLYDASLAAPYCSRTSRVIVASAASVAATSSTSRASLSAVAAAAI
jgi:hypothetical protein